MTDRHSYCPDGRRHTTSEMPLPRVKTWSTKSFRFSPHLPLTCLNLCGFVRRRVHWTVTALRQDCNLSMLHPSTVPACPPRLGHHSLQSALPRYRRPNTIKESRNRCLGWNPILAVVAVRRFHRQPPPRVIPDHQPPLFFPRYVGDASVLVRSSLIISFALLKASRCSTNNLVSSAPAINPDESQ
ncbi:hypothetical protein BDZ89DRAFT_662547 [Hymenopellis radicata]|nr:hypothetical protein BDZ89DRAFT_662547 [Hymenopellis radicata]